ncbi:MAG: flagellar basal body P-ring formation protein FlgA [Nitrospirae bacterium]|nr:flagellar basal body P-ring formation protein FlgA [Nitrospirota bacterium]
MRNEINNSLRITLFPLFVLLTLNFLFFVSDVYAQPKQLTDTVKRAVLAELVRSVSENVELNGIKFLKGLETLDDNCNYSITSIAMDGYNGPNKIVYLVSLGDEHKTVRKLHVEASFDVLTSVYVAAKPLSGGTVVSGDDFYSVKQKNSRLPAGAITDIGEIEGKRLKSNVAQGVILRANNFGNSQGMKKSREVTVLVEGINVIISTRGVLSNDPPVGGAARVLCNASKKEIAGTLISQDTVRVKI